jgi:hypothetical protein
VGSRAKLRDLLCGSSGLLRQVPENALTLHLQRKHSRDPSTTRPSAMCRRCSSRRFAQDDRGWGRRSEAAVITGRELRVSSFSETISRSEARDRAASKVGFSREAEESAPRAFRAVETVRENALTLHLDGKHPRDPSTPRPSATGERCSFEALRSG